MDGYVSTKTARKILGVTTPTLVNWSKKGKIGFVISPSGTRLYCSKDIFNITGKPVSSEEKQKICYCRVSSKKQMDDFERQKDFFRNKFPDYNLVTDVGSGINWKRKGLRTILEQSMQGKVSEVVVAHRDRICRFGFELIEFILKKNQTKLIVLNDESGESADSDLADDIVSIIHVYSCRKMGRRRYSNKMQENKNIPYKVSKNHSEKMDGN